MNEKENYKLAKKKNGKQKTAIKFMRHKNPAEIGGGKISVIAGPCSVENRENFFQIAKAIKKAGAAFLRGGAFKPRTNPYNFQGLGKEGVKILLEAGNEFGLYVVSEITEISQLEILADVDMVQVGARNMQNYELLRELGRSKKPVLLKRGMSATMSELLFAAEHIMSGGNTNIVLCERGIRSFDTFTRNVFDIAIIPALKEKTHLPVIADPSHATGVSFLVPPMSKAALAAGADGLIIEVHNDPKNALCDGEQSLTPEEFALLMKEIRNLKSQNSL